MITNYHLPFVNTGNITSNITITNITVDSMSSCNQSERDAIFGRDSYERKLSNHHDEGRRQGATAIIEFFSRLACVRRRGRLCHGTMAQWPVQACLGPLKEKNCGPRAS